RAVRGVASRPQPILRLQDLRPGTTRWGNLRLWDGWRGPLSLGCALRPSAVRRKSGVGSAVARDGSARGGAERVRGARAIAYPSAGGAAVLRRTLAVRHISGARRKRSGFFGAEGVRGRGGSLARISRRPGQARLRTAHAPGQRRRAGHGARQAVGGRVGGATRYSLEPRALV